MKATKADRSTPVADGDQWLVGGGEMGEFIRSMDWSATPLGPLEDWPDSLRTTVNLCLSSNFPINIVWGGKYNQIYNDGYRAIVGERHPEGMGMAYDECWASAWPAIGKPFEQAWLGETSFLENQRMYLTRNGYLEETFFTFSLSPIRNESGVISGLFHPVNETTSTMLAERRSSALRELGVATSAARSLEAAFTGVAASLAAQRWDMPFVLLYALDEDGKGARLVASTGIESSSPASQGLLRQVEDSSIDWPLQQLLGSESPVAVTDLRTRFGDFECGPYPEGADSAIGCALRIAGVTRPLGVFIAGISPRLPLDQTYRNYLEQICTATGTALANALAHEQERKRAEALAEIDRAKSQFFANVSHEFRTPLALMLGPIETVLATSSSEISGPNRRHLQMARRNSLRLLKLVNTLLDFSRVEAGRVEATFEPTDLARFTAEISANFQSAVESAGMSFAVDCPPLPRPVYVDRDMWEKIVLNLISNAFKFTMRGGIKVTLSRVGDDVHLVVADTGSGIAADQLSQVFKRFHRVENSRGRTHEGSGIGLALVDEFSRLHHGKASVESAVGEGSRFTVSIPLDEKHLPLDRLASPSSLRSWTRVDAFTEEAARWDVAQPTEGVSPATATKPSALAPGTPHIILAEDNADMRDYIVRVLGEGFAITTVGNGEEALAAALAELPDLVLSDVMMPRMDGFELVQALRGNDRTSMVPIILLSARAGDEARADGVERGADDYLVKPFSPKELKARVGTQLELHRLRSTVAAMSESGRVAQ